MSNEKGRGMMKRLISALAVALAFGGRASADPPTPVLPFSSQPSMSQPPNWLSGVTPGPPLSSMTEEQKLELLKESCRFTLKKAGMNPKRCDDEKYLKKFLARREKVKKHVVKKPKLNKPPARNEVVAPKPPPAMIPPAPVSVVEREVPVKIIVKPNVVVEQPAKVSLNIPYPTPNPAPTGRPAQTRPLVQSNQKSWIGRLDVGPKAMPGAFAFMGGAEIGLPLAGDFFFNLRYMAGPTWVKKDQGVVTRIASDLTLFLQLPKNFYVGPNLSFAGAPITRFTYLMVGGTGAYQWNLGRIGIRPEVTVGYVRTNIISIGQGIRATGGLMMVYQVF